MSRLKRVSRRRVVVALVDMLASGASVKRVAQTLASYLVEVGEARNVELYLRDIRNELTNRFGVVAVDVCSAEQLSNQTRTNIARLIKNTTGAKTVEIIETVDKSLIGGVIIKTADAELDGSVRTKLQKLRSI